MSRAAGIVITGVVVLVIVAACDRRETTSPAPAASVLPPTAPSPATDCTYQVSPAFAFLPRVPWSTDVSITTTPGCRWTASSDAGWLRASSAAGSGSAVLTVSADFNPATDYASKRTAVLAIRWDGATGGQDLRVTQSGDCGATPYPPPGGLPPGVALSDRTLTVGGPGGRIHLAILTDPYTGCAWTAESADQWITWESPGLHRVMPGDGDFYFTVPPNTTGQARQAVVTMDLRPLVIVQNAR